MHIINGGMFTMLKGVLELSFFLTIIISILVKN